MAFPTTRWTLLAQATLHGDAAQGEALAEFYRRYREPVVHFIARQQRDRTHAEDLAQEFFVHMAESSTLQRADPLQGRFRSFLLGALLRFLERERVRGAAAKRGGGEVPLSFDALRSGRGEPTVPAEISAAFDREWALGLIVRVRHELGAEWKGTAPEWVTLLQFLPGAAQTPTYEAAAAALGWTLARLKTEVFRVRQGFRERVRAEVALTVDAPHEIEQEMGHLHHVLSHPAT
jgi:DNA-directed RNA polymerase specialized sigma24 family protein